MPRCCPGPASWPAPRASSDLLSPADADELLSRRGLRTPFLRVAKDGRLVPAARYTGAGGTGAEIADQVLDEKVLALYADGATLVLQGLHRIWPPLVDFARELGAALGQPLQINAYLTPPGSQGFATHYDTHDVFVLQVDGRKRWRIHEPVLADPLDRQAWGGRADEVSATASGEPALDVVLEPGDALYLPRGWLHSAQAQGDSSLHLTVGIQALTRYALVEELLGLAAEEPRLRATLPFGLDVTDAGAGRAGADRDRRGAARLARHRRPGRRRRAAAHAVRGPPPGRRRCARWPRPRSWPRSPRTTASRRARRCAGAWTRTAPTGSRCGSSTASVSFPAGCAPALRAFLAGSVTRVGDLPGLDTDDDRLVLARRLLREAVAVPG